MLAAGLVSKIKKICPEAFFEGIGGTCMEATGVKICFPLEKIAAIGISQALIRGFSIHRTRRALYQHFLDNKIDIFIGVDAPDFNFWLEKRFRKIGVKTVHFISPSVWAWREYRLKKIRQCTDLMLSVFPFEEALYRKYQIPVQYVGHPLANQLPKIPDQTSALARLQLSTDKTTIALLPGSRQSEVKHLTPVFLETAVKLAAEYPELQFITSLTSEAFEARFLQLKAQIAPQLSIKIFINDSHKVIEASDLLLLASGTVTLEAMLLHKPMVVAYKTGWFNYYLLKNLVQLPYVSLPNILAGRFVVPECLQKDCHAQKLVAELLAWLKDRQRIQQTKVLFKEIGETLRKNASHEGAKAVLGLL